MLLSLKQLNFHAQKLKQNFELGEIVQNRRLEENKVNDFTFSFDKLLRHLIELQAITKNESNDYVQDSQTALVKTNQKVNKLSKRANFVNSDMQKITQKLNVIIDRKKKTVEDVKLNLKDVVELVVEFKDKHKDLDSVLNKLQEVFDTNYSDTEEEIDLLNNDLKQALYYVEGMKVKNKDLELIVMELYKKLDDAIFLLKDEIELKDFVYDTSLQATPIDVIEEIGKKIRLGRDATMFEGNMGEGDFSTTIKKNIDDKYTLYSYGTDPDVDNCRAAQKNGVDFVAKKGIYKISHNTFDLVLNFMNEFTFIENEKDIFTSISPEESRFSFIFNRSIPKSGAYVLFNIPYFRIPAFMRKIRSMLTIDGLYKIDDDIKNVLFVCRYKQSTRNENRKFSRAIMEYDKLPHYTEMNEIVINRGDISHPQTYRAYFVDSEDLESAFKTEIPTFDIVEDSYRPKEKVIELNRPLQEYKEGHLPAVATIEIVNGVYDLGKEIDFPNIYSTKIVQQDIEDEQEEMYKGQKVKIISQKKKNVIVSKILRPDGEIIELLNTK